MLNSKPDYWGQFLAREIQCWKSLLLNSTGKLYYLLAPSYFYTNITPEIKGKSFCFSCFSYMNIIAWSAVPSGYCNQIISFISDKKYFFSLFLTVIETLDTWYLCCQVRCDVMCAIDSSVHDYIHTYTTQHMIHPILHILSASQPQCHSPP